MGSTPNELTAMVVETIDRSPLVFMSICKKRTDRRKQLLHAQEKNPADAGFFGASTMREQRGLRTAALQRIVQDERVTLFGVHPDGLKPG